MKRLFLIISLLIFSIDTLADDAKCVPPLTNPKLQLAPYIYRIINAKENTDDHRLEKLRELIGIRITGWHRYYPKKQRYKESISVDGVIHDVVVLKPSEDFRKIIYEMTISSENGLQKFAFSGSYSPAFSILETDQDLPALLAEKIAAVQDMESPFDLLSVGLDTPPEIADYKNTLRSQGAVVFDSKEYPYYEFSPSYERPIVIRGEIWPSVRHYVCAQQFVDTEGFCTEHVFDIRVAALEEIETIVRNKSHLIRFHSDWKKVRDEIMFEALAAKFTQHEDLYKSLMDTEDSLIINHTERNLYWGDGEDSTGISMLGELLMKLRDQLRNGMALYEGEWFPAAALWGYLLRLIEVSHSHDADNLARQIAFSSDMSDVEKVDRMQRLLDSRYFFRRRSGQLLQNRTSVDEWIAFVDTKYSDEAFKYELIKAGVSAAGQDVEVTSLNELDIPHNQKIEIYKIMIRQQRNYQFARDRLLHLNLSHLELRELSLYLLQLQPFTDIIKQLPREIVDDAFIQEVVNALNNGFSRAYILQGDDEEHRKQRNAAISILITAAASHGLNYRAIYTVDDKLFTESSEQERHDHPETYPQIHKDPIKLILINNNQNTDI